MTLEDNGVGFDLNSALTKASHDKGLGIPGMKERAEQTNGCFQILSDSGTGTTIQVSWPV